MTDAAHARALLVRIAWMFALATVGVGVALRLAFAGVIPMPLAVDDVRHAHSHAGYFGVLFPLVWLAWSRAGAPILNTRQLQIYAGAAGVACAGFAFLGYGPLTIAASTALGALWLWSAWQARAFVAPRHGWLRTGPIGIALASALVPAIGILTPRDAVLGTRLAHTFLALLMFTVIVPAALARQLAPPVRAGLWLVLSLGASLELGVWSHPIPRLCLVGLGGALAWVSARARGDLIVRLGMGACGLAAVLGGAIGVISLYSVAIASVHVLVLGAALPALAPMRSRGEGVLLLCAAFGMGASLVLQDLARFLPELEPVAARGQVLAAVFGALVLVPLVRALAAPPPQDD